MVELPKANIEWTVHSRNTYGILRYGETQPTIEAKISGLTKLQNDEVAGDASSVRQYYSSGHETKGESTFIFDSIDEARALLPALNFAGIEGTRSMQREFEGRVAEEFRQALSGGKATIS